MFIRSPVDQVSADKVEREIDDFIAAVEELNAHLQGLTKEITSSPR